MRDSKMLLSAATLAIATTVLGGCGGSSGPPAILNPGSPTATPTAAIGSAAPSNAASASPSAAATATSSGTPAAGASATPGGGATASATPAAVATVTPSSSATPAASPTAVAATPSATPAGTPTGPPTVGPVASSTAFAVKTIAGSGTGNSFDGTGAGASFSMPVGVAYVATAQGADPTLFVSDEGTGFLRGLDLKTFAVTTYDNRSFSASALFGIAAATGTTGNALEVAAGSDVYNIALPTTVDPAATPAPIGKALGAPVAAALDTQGDIYTTGSDANFYELESSAGALFARVSLSTTFPQGGNFGLVVTGTPAGAYYTDMAANTLSSATTTPMMATSTILATGGALNAPAGMTLLNGNLYIANCGGNDIVKATTTGTLTVVAGSGAASEADGANVAASFACPFGITNDGTNLYVSDLNGNTIREITNVP